MNARSVIDKVVPPSLLILIEQNHSRAQARLLSTFARHYFSSTSRTEIASTPAAQLYQILMEAWVFFNKRPNDTAVIDFSQFDDAPEITPATENKATRSNKRTQRRRTTVHIMTKDRPFLVDSIRQQLSLKGYSIHSVSNAVLRNSRGKTGKLRTIVPEKDYQSAQQGNATQASHKQYVKQAMIDLHCDVLTEQQCQQVEVLIRDTLKDVVVATDDYKAMCKRLSEVQQRCQKNRKSIPVSQLEFGEADAFISWLLDDHFTFLGYERYELHTEASKSAKSTDIQLRYIGKSALGISKYKPGLKPKMLIKDLPKKLAGHILAPRCCDFAKSSTRSKVHRPGYYDYVLLKEFNDKGEVVTEHRFLGLYTSAVYYRNVLSIPILRYKVSQVLNNSGFPPKGHSIKDLEQVINILPRDELFQMRYEELLATALDITHIQEMRLTRLFVRRDSYGQFFSCLAYVPRDIYNTETRKKMERFLMQELDGDDIEFNVYFSESFHARIHFIVRSNSVDSVKLDAEALERKMVELVKPWNDLFSDALETQYNLSEMAPLLERYQNCFPVTYKESYSAVEAVSAIEKIEQAINSGSLSLQMSKLADVDSSSAAHGDDDTFHFRIFAPESSLMLSDVAPILENMGCRVISESTYQLKPGSKSVWLHDFTLCAQWVGRNGLESFKENFKKGFLAVWSDEAGDDKFSALIAAANLRWRDVALLRAYAAYMKQIQLGYSKSYVASTLVRYKDLSALILRLFYDKFDPSLNDDTRAQRSKNLLKKSELLIEQVENLSEDSILRAYINVVKATVRTNYFQPHSDGGEKAYFSFKLLPREVPGMPLPKPQYEIFVYSPEVEGVHLRGGKVARGGLRWSDRHEDYRTEVLGLVKAQQVKNAVIVPVGAKGGFVVKKAVASNDRAAYMEQGISCYKTFISALLDITDNIKNGDTVPPQQVVRHDDDDPYMVVAADKGTATFSDIANGIALERQFWMGDGFASGGSNGYDHKKMGITAKGAWVSVQRHFRELGTNIQKENFSVVGIGDMSGDVFGNGMLLSRHIQLLAAFNHLHIFIDPTPNITASFKERARLFRKGRSSWSDYDQSLMSKGGGIFLRQAKSIPISAEMQQQFAIDASSLTPDELITALLKSPVDLVWNGGIGTYVKATSESHGEVGDKANDCLRVNGNELRCRVVGEGGNLGLTQKARVEYGLSGGVSYTDFIDNSAGVDCSDHEVNIKILLSQLSATGRLDDTARSTLLAKMTEEVSSLVLNNNYHQVQALGLAQSQSLARTREYAGLLSFLEVKAGLDRQIENLPSVEEIDERVVKQQGLSRPELAVLTSYIKMYLKAQLSNAEYIDDPYLESHLFSAFPGFLVQQHKAEIRQHPLRPQIVATQVANSAVNFLGPSFVYRLSESSGASAENIVKAAIIARDIYDVDDLWREIERYDYKVDSQIQDHMMLQITRLMRRVTRWLLRNKRGDLDFTSTIAALKPRIRNARKLFPQLLPAQLKERYEEACTAYMKAGISQELASRVAELQFVHSLTSIAEIEAATGDSARMTMDIYFSVGETLKLNWLGRLINELPVNDYWQALARETFQDDLEWQQRALTRNIVLSRGKSRKAEVLVNRWREKHSAAIERSHTMLAQLQREGSAEYPMFSVTLRELLNLAQSTAYHQS